MTAEFTGVRNETEYDSLQRIERWRREVPIEEERDLPGPGEAFGPEYEASRGDALSEGGVKSAKHPGSALRQISRAGDVSSSDSIDVPGVPELGPGGDGGREVSGEGAGEKAEHKSVIRPIDKPVGAKKSGSRQGERRILRPISPESSTLRDKFPTDEEVLNGIGGDSKSEKSSVIRPIKPE